MTTDLYQRGLDMINLNRYRVRPTLCFANELASECA